MKDTRRYVLSTLGACEGTIALHEYLLELPAKTERSTQELADQFGVTKRSITRWARPLIDGGYVSWTDAPGAEEGGRLCATMRVNRSRSRRSFGKLVDEMVAKVESV